MAKNYSASKSRAKGFVAAKRDVGLLVTEVVRLMRIKDEVANAFRERSRAP
jgi:hypothetical protein